MSDDRALQLDHREAKLTLVGTVYRGRIAHLDEDSDAGRLARLRHALLKADRETARDLLADRTLARAPDREGAEPIHDAALGGDPVLVQGLLAMGADPDQTSELGRTPLCEAALRGHAGAIRILLAAGARADVAPATGDPPLLEAGYRNGESQIALLVLAGAPVAVRTRNFPHATPLHRAAEFGDAAGTAALLDHGAETESADERGERPLHRAAAYGHVEVVDLLLAHGAAVDPESRDRMTPLMKASTLKPAVMRRLLAAGAAVDRQDANGRTILGHAVGSGDLATVQAIVGAGIPVDPPDGAGRSALQEAVDHRHLALARWLLDEQQADVNYQDCRLRLSPLMIAADGGVADLVASLLGHGADPALRDHNGRTALHFAAARGHADLVATLLAAGADPEAHDDLGFTPLMVASSTAMVWKRDGEAAAAVAVLLDRGVVVDAADRSGWTALHHAAYAGHARAARQLLAAGADFTVRNDRRARPLDVAMTARVPHPYEDRRWVVPAVRAGDPFYDVVAALLEAEIARGLHPRRRASLMRKAREFRCPEVQDLLRR